MGVPAMVVDERMLSAETGAGSPLVRIRGLRKRYGRQQAVRGVDLEVLSGEIYGLIGPDGAGKSSLKIGRAHV